MATPEEICNRALSNVHISTLIQNLDTDKSKEGHACKLWYAASLGFALEDFDWNFARRRIALAEIVSTQKPDYWAHAYAFPAACAKPRWIEVPGLRTPHSEARIRFETAGENLSTGDRRVIYTNQPSAILVYTKYVEDAGMFDEHFSQALAWLLAANIGGPLTVNRNLVLLASDQYQRMRYNAIAADMVEGVEDVEPATETERYRNG